MASAKRKPPMIDDSGLECIKANITEHQMLHLMQQIFLANCLEKNHGVFCLN